MKRYIGQRVQLDRDVKIEFLSDEIDIIPKGTWVTLVKAGFLWKRKTVLSEDIKADELDAGTLAKYIIDNCDYIEKESYDDEIYVNVAETEESYFKDCLENLLSDLF